MSAIIMNGNRLSIVLIGLITVSTVVSGHAQPLPLFFNRTYGDARDVIASQPRKFKLEDLAWQPKIAPRGEPAGETSVIVRFEQAAKRFPIRFGIPLGQVASCDNVAVFDEAGKQIAADVFGLVNFHTCRQHWVMIATVLEAPAAREQRLTIKWGPDIQRSVSTRKLICKETNGALTVRGGRIGFTLSAEKLLSDIRMAGSQTVFAPSGSLAGFKPQGRKFEKHRGGKISKLFDGPLYKRFRIESTIMNDRFKLHFEVETWADSPYLLVSSRIINESNTAYKLSDLTPLAFCSSGDRYAIRAGGEANSALSAQKEIAVTQRVDNWSILGDGQELAKGTKDAPGEYVQLIDGSDALTLIVPDFQGFGPGDPDLESRLLASNKGDLILRHYTSYPPDAGGTITFWDTMARTFRMVLHIGSAAQSPASTAAPVRAQPLVRYDRQFLTEQGVFNEERVTNVYDEPSLEGARYFIRARVCRHDYPRMGRGMPPQKGEGLEHPYTDTGGMLFGEVWQYTSANPGFGANILARARVPNGNLPEWYDQKERGGILTYRCGDHTLALVLSYLRTGDREVFDMLQDHSLLYADWAIAHPKGYCHYYCDWHSDNHCYSRLSGLLLGYLVNGEPWLFEVAEQMAGHLVRDWKGDDYPRDEQTRSAYPARGLTWLYEVTGHRSYWNNAVDLAIWVMQTGMEPDGGMRCFAHHKYYYRISPLYAGYTLLGLMPVYERCGNQALLKAIRKCGDWLLTCQGKMNEGVGAGTWPRDTIMQKRKNVGPGNSGSTTLCAEIQTFLAQITDEPRYFYSAAAAWANLVTGTRHQQIKGGLPMQLGDARKTGTWSDKLPIYLNRLPAVAEKLQLPFVIEGVYDDNPENKSPVIVFVAAGGNFDGNVFKQPLYAANDSAATIPVWCPTEPIEARFGSSNLPFSYNSKTRIAQVILPVNSSPDVLTISFGAVRG